MVATALELEIAFEWNTFRMGQAELAAALHEPINADLYARALRVANAARDFASGRGGEGPHVRTGRLWGSIGIRIGRDSMSPYVDIGTAAAYAPFVEWGHNNTAHVYPIMTPGGTFTGQFGYVSNKPTRAYPFLRPAIPFARSV